MDTQQQILKSFRVANGVTQAELASLIGVTQTAISQYEKPNSDKWHRDVSGKVAMRLHNLDPGHFSLDVLLCPECSSEAA